MKNNVFKKSSMERIASPEKLDDFIKVSNPSSWMVLGAALALLFGLLVWGIFGQLSQSVTFNGHLKDDHLYCYASGNLAEQLMPGMDVSIAVQGAESLSGRILSVAEHPLSFDGRPAISPLTTCCPPWASPAGTSSSSSKRTRPCMKAWCTPFPL